jgi:hypothetical protein
MQPRLAALIILIAVVFIVLVIVAVRNRRMSEPIAVFWMLLFAALGGFSLLASRRFIDHLAELLGIVYAPSLYFLLGMVVVFGVLFYFSIQLSVLGRLVRGLVQEVAILNREIEAVREERPARGEER